MNELKPCPFCGKPADVTIGPSGEEARCSDEDCIAGLAWGPIEAWNRRAAPDALVEALREKLAQEVDTDFRDDVEAVSWRVIQNILDAALRPEREGGKK